MAVPIAERSVGYGHGTNVAAILSNREPLVNDQPAPPPTTTFCQALVPALHRTRGAFQKEERGAILSEEQRKKAFFTDLVRSIFTDNPPERRSSEDLYNLGLCLYALSVVEGEALGTNQHSNLATTAYIVAPFVAQEWQRRNPDASDAVKAAARTVVKFSTNAPLESQRLLSLHMVTDIVQKTDATSFAISLPKEQQPVLHTPGVG